MAQVAAGCRAISHRSADELARVIVVHVFEPGRPYGGPKFQEHINFFNRYGAELLGHCSFSAIGCCNSRRQNITVITVRPSCYIPCSARGIRLSPPCAD
jgi:hypothetical protein